MREQTKHFDERVFKYGVNRLKAQIELNLAEVGHEF